MKCWSRGRGKACSVATFYQENWTYFLCPIFIKTKSLTVSVTKPTTDSATEPPNESTTKPLIELVTKTSSDSNTITPVVLLPTVAPSKSKQNVIPIALVVLFFVLCVLLVVAILLYRRRKRWVLFVLVNLI